MPAHTLNRIDKHSGIVILTAGFGIFYAIILFLNHFTFNTSIYDLGINTNALYDYSRLQWNDSMLLKSTKQNLLGEHFDLYLIFLTPLSYLLKSYTLPLVQVISICVGGVGIYRYFLYITESKRFANAASLYFFSFFGIYSSLLYTYESYAVAMMIVPWFFYYFHKERFSTAVFLFVLIIISRESSSLWMTVILLGMMANYISNWRLAKKLLELSLISFLYYLLVTEVIMPSFSPAETNVQFEYSGVGETYLKSVGWIIGHPVLVMKMLLFNHLGIEGYEYTKMIFLGFLFLSGGVFLIFRPQYIFMLIPVIFSKLLSDHADLWGIDGPYVIAFTPILTIGIFSYLGSIWQVALRRALLIIIICASMFLTVVFFIMFSPDTNPRSLVNLEKVKSVPNSLIINKALNKIPSSSEVSAEYEYVPMLSYRDNIHTFPVIDNAEYIVINKRKHLPDSVSLDPYFVAVTEIINSKEWTIDYQQDQFFILKRRSPN